MKILISCIPFDGGRSGISVYTRSLVNALAEEGHELTLLVEPGASEFFPGFRTIEAPPAAKRAVFSMLYHLFILPFRIARMKKEFDFCIVAAANRRIFSFFPLFTIAVVHDLAQYHVEAKYDAFRTFYLKRVLPFFIRRTPHIVAVSESTRKDIIRFWKADPAKITVNLNGRAVLPDGTGGRAWLAEHSLEKGGYIFYVSRIEHPGKNHITLIRAYEKLPDALTDKIKLVFAGSDWRNAETVRNRAANSRLADRIVFTGFIADADLADAYKNAALYVFPSFYEGFGLSLVEAMHCGVPCCASDNSSLGEIGRGAARLFPPADADAMSTALRDVLTNPVLREKLVAAGRVRAAEFDWRKHARKMLEIFNCHEQN